MKSYKAYVKKGNSQGTISSVYYTIVKIKDMSNVKYHDLVAFESGGYAQVISVEKQLVTAVLLDNPDVRSGERCVLAGGSLEVPVSTALLGMSVTPLGKPLRGSYGKGRYEKRCIDSKAPLLNERALIRDQFKTGIKILDLMLPLAYGQRQLVIGNRKTGKTPFLVQSAKSMIKAGGLCVYASIGRKLIDIALLEQSFKKNGILDKCVLVTSSAANTPGMVYLTPYSAMTIAEYFRDQGAKVLLILDDMTTHAKYYRELSLLAGRFPGRDSYPGDIFYIHSKLMERSGNFKLTLNGEQSEASITCLPVANMVMDDFSGYIQTNLMAMTDGHIYFDTERYNKGVFPAINPFLSVTRVGRQTQEKILKDSGTAITRFLVRVEELQQFAHFGAEVSSVTRKDIDTGRKLQELLNQDIEEYIVIEAFLFITAILFTGIWKDVSVNQTMVEANKLMQTYKDNEIFRMQVDELIDNATSFSNLVYEIEKNPALYREYLGSSGQQN